MGSWNLLILTLGHYIGWTRKEDPIAASGDQEWYKFDGEGLNPMRELNDTDDKVSVTTA